MSRAPTPPASAASAASGLASCLIGGTGATPRSRQAPDAVRRVATWARRVRARLREVGLRVQTRVTDDRIVFARAGADIGEAAVRLVLAVDTHGISVALEIPGEGLRAARARLADPERALELTAAFEALPEQFALSLGDQGPFLAASRASADDLRALVDRAHLPRRTLSVGWSVARDVALEHAAVLDDQLEDAIVALGAAFALLGDPKRAGGEEDRKSDKRRARAHPRDFDAARDRDGEGSSGSRSGGDAEPEPGRERDPASKSPRTLGHKPLRLGGRRRPLAEARPADGIIDKGARVRVLDGPFAGKVGVVHELDGKGGARVMLGLLAVRLAVKDLAAFPGAPQPPRAFVVPPQAASRSIVTTEGRHPASYVAGE